MKTNYNNGHVIDVAEMTVNEYEIAAKEWSEGSKNFEELLLYCLKNGIITKSCCTGHKENDTAFLQFELSEKNRKAIIKIINRYYNLNGVNMFFVNQPGEISKFDIGVPKNMGDQFFKDMLIQLSNGLDIGIDSLTSDMQSTIAALTSHKIPNEYLEIQYSMNDNRKELFVATTNPNYYELYWDKDNAKPWVEDSIGIEGTPESIEPIIRDISKKTSFEYRKYVENQTRLNKIASSLATSMKSKTDKRGMPEIDGAERINSIAIYEVLPGMTIDDVTQEICGQRYLCKFNNFEIDGTKYKSPAEIVSAYKKHWEDGKKRLLESKKMQEQIDNSIRQQQFASLANDKNLISNTDLEEAGLKR